ncbi:MAG: 30S ribosome-binding factor RbfA [Hydrogenothermaceae bacterium]|nr:30S ribosome-binding factor RbfA [Hydrogenothermaceae bacterium]
MEKKTSRMKKINSLLKKEISSILQEEYEFGRDNFISINLVDTKTDLSLADVYISSLKEEEEIVESLNKESKHIRYILSKRIDIKKTPQLRFKVDKFNVVL